jgi:hypothetical protein
MDVDNDICRQIAALTATHTQAEIAEIVGISRAAVHRRLIAMGVRTQTPRGRKRLPPVKGICPTCKVEFTLDSSQRDHIKKGQQPCCSKECLHQHRVYWATNYEGYKDGPEHNRWKHGHASTETFNKVINYLAEHGNAPAAEIRKVIGECTWATVSNARRALDIPLQTSFKHGYYTNVAKEARDTIRKINKFIREGARA